ncbi:Rne/Rng family ribonuclease [Gordonia sp. NPDC003425]
MTDNGSPADANAASDPAQDFPSKLRVHALARVLGLTSRQVLAHLAELGWHSRSPQSSVERDVAQAVAARVRDHVEVDESAVAVEEAPARADSDAPAQPDSDAPAHTSSPASPAGDASTEVSPADGGETSTPQTADAPSLFSAIEVPEPVPPQAFEDAAASPLFLQPTAAEVAAATKPAAKPDQQKPDQQKPDQQKPNQQKAESQDRAPQEKPSQQKATVEGDEAESAAENTDTDDDSSGNGRNRKRRRGRRGRGRGRGDQNERTDSGDDQESDAGEQSGADSSDNERDESSDSPARPSGKRRKKPSKAGADADSADTDDEQSDSSDTNEDGSADGNEADGEGSSSKRRRRRRRRKGGAEAEEGSPDDPPNTVVHEREPRSKRARDEVQGISGSTRLEAKRQRRRDGRDAGRRRPPILSESEFLARREAVDRVMVVRERSANNLLAQPSGDGHAHATPIEDYTQVAVLEDGILVEHFVTTETSSSMVGNIYLGRVQNVLPGMEAAFVDIGRGRNGVLYAGEVNWDAAGLDGGSRKIEQALKPGDNVLVQVSKDPVGHKGARLTTQISLAGRYLVYVPGGSSTGISRKLPDVERKRLKQVLAKLVPEDAGVIIRTASEGVSAEDLGADIERLENQWKSIDDAFQKAKKGSGSVSPRALYEEPDLLVRVVRDMFNEDFKKLVVEGDKAWNLVEGYVSSVAPDLMDRVQRFERPHADAPDSFVVHRIDEQLAKALDRKVWLPSGGTLIIEHTEAMTVVDVNTGKFTGSGGNLEETVTRNNLEAAEEIVRQMRLRDIGGMIIVDFIDMVLESNRDLVLRRLTEALARDRTRHQVSEVTSLGLVQMTRKRLGTGLLEAFSTTCTTCGGRGIIVHSSPVEIRTEDTDRADGSGSKRSRRGKKKNDQPEPKPAPTHNPSEHPMFRAMAAHSHDTDSSVPETESSVPDTASSVPDTGSSVPDTGSSVPDTGSSVPETGSSVPDTGAVKRRRRAVRRAASPTTTSPEVVSVTSPAPAQPLTTFGPVSTETAPVAVRRRPRRRTAGRPAGPPVED